LNLPNIAPPNENKEFFFIAGGLVSGKFWYWHNKSEQKNFEDHDGRIRRPSLPVKNDGFIHEDFQTFSILLQFFYKEFNVSLEMLILLFGKNVFETI
jgi:hypothetical protein